MQARWTVDTNILIYAMDDGDPARRLVARRIVAELASASASLCLQVVGEFYAVAVRKLRIPPPVAADLANKFLTAFPGFGATEASMARALTEAAAGRFSFWDANLLSAAEAAGCTHLLTEDMTDGQRLGRLEIVHPFAGDALSQRARSLLEL